MPAVNTVMTQTSTFVTQKSSQMDPVYRAYLQAKVAALQAQDDNYQPLSPFWKGAAGNAATYLQAVTGLGSAVTDLAGALSSSLSERVLGLASVAGDLTGIPSSDNQQLQYAQFTAASMGFTYSLLTTDDPVLLGLQANFYIYGSFVAPQLATLASDPPSSNYRTPITVPLIPAPPVPAGLPADVTTLLGELNSATIRATTYAQAVRASVDRYGGAIAANDSSSALIQMGAILDYLQLLGTALRDSDKAVNQLPAILAANGYADLRGDASTWQAVQQALIASNGLPADLVAFLASQGVSSDQMTALYNQLIQFDVTSVPQGPRLYDAAIAASQQLDNIAGKTPTVLWRNANGDVSLWFMSGGSIASSVDFGVIPSSWAIQGTGDFNGDGNSDILWRNANGDVVTWFMNGSTIASSTDLGVIPASWTVQGTGDFNGDGTTDILWRNANGDVVVWFMNAGSIASSADLGVISSDWTIQGAGDFDGDGKTDILWRNANGDVVVWFMNGGTIASSADLGVIPSDWSIQRTGDFDGDGKSDILWRNVNGDVVVWFMNAGTIASSADLGVIPSSWTIQGTGDFNGDGKADILWRNSNGDVVTWLMNGGAISSSTDLGVIPMSWAINATGR
jgi:hypothetical protein